MKKFRLKNKRTEIWSITVTLIVGSMLTYSWVSHYRFRKHEVHSTIVSTDDWWGRSIQFILADGYSFYIPTSKSNKVGIGDSVSKKGNSCDLQVFKKGFEKVYDSCLYFNVDDGKFK